MYGSCMEANYLLTGVGTAIIELFGSFIYLIFKYFSERWSFIIGLVSMSDS